MADEKYKFSVPMPFHKEHIELINDINKNIEKSMISSFYFSLPINCELYTGFEQARNSSANTSLEYWSDILKKAIDDGYEVIYTLNNPNINITNNDFKIKKEKLDKLINALVKSGCNTFRISNLRLLSYFVRNYPKIKLYSSTSFEYKTIKEYRNFSILYPKVQQIIPSHDNNKNFKLLKNLKKHFTNTDIELIVNEGCLGGCPLRREHSCAQPTDNIYPFNSSYHIDKCSQIYKRNLFLELCKSNMIFPWDIKEYGKIGIKNFKLVGRDNYSNMNSGNLFEDYYIYLSGIDDYRSIKNKSLRIFIHRLRNNDTLLKYNIDDIKDYLPDIEYFKKYGHLCSSICEIECKYCYKCAEKINKKLKIK